MECTTPRAGSACISAFAQGMRGEQWLASPNRSKLACAHRRTQNRPALAGSADFAGSVIVGGAGGVGATLFGLTSLLPTNVTPSSITSLGVRISPNNSVLVLMSIFSLATMLPLIFPRTTTMLTLMFPFTTALSPRLRLPSELISPSSFPSKVISPENLSVPLISTSEFSAFLELFGVLLLDVFMSVCAQFCFSLACVNPPMMLLSTLVNKICKVSFGLRAGADLIFGENDERRL